MTSIDHLLPEPDQVLRCAEHQRFLGVDPGGTAIRADRVVLVETPLPWPKPVADHPHLAPMAAILKASSVPTRTLAYTSGSVDGSGNGDGSPAAPVITFDRSDPGTVVERRYPADTVEARIRLAAALAEDDTGLLASLAVHDRPLVSPVALVCTQGSHDVCCGSEGARFAADAEAISDLTVYRVSHTGGHRFAPTAMTLPDGRMWADLDVPLLRQILSRTGDAAEVVDRCRGWWGIPTGPAQLAERAVLAADGWALEDRDRTVEVGDDHDGTATCVVSDGERAWSVAVTAARTVPTIACRQPGGLPAKPATEYRAGRAVPIS
ncbi:MAG: sucrase ferredoxin [Actinomycetota bacterium]